MRTSGSGEVVATTLIGDPKTVNSFTSASVTTAQEGGKQIIAGEKANNRWAKVMVYIKSLRTHFCGFVSNFKKSELELSMNLFKRTRIMKQVWLVVA